MRALVLSAAEAAVEGWSLCRRLRSPSAGTRWRTRPRSQRRPTTRHARWPASASGTRGYPRTSPACGRSRPARAGRADGACAGGGRGLVDRAVGDGAAGGDPARAGCSGPARRCAGLGPRPGQPAGPRPRPRGSPDTACGRAHRPRRRRAGSGWRRRPAGRSSSRPWTWRAIGWSWRSGTWTPRTRWHCWSPAMDNSPADDLRRLTDDARDVASSARAAAPGLSVATVVWLGYRAPASLVRGRHTGGGHARRTRAGGRSGRPGGRTDGDR